MWHKQNAYLFIFCSNSSGGLTNYLYKCQIDNPRVQMFSNEPKQILLR